MSVSLAESLRRPTRRAGAVLVALGLAAFISLTLDTDARAQQLQQQPSAQSEQSLDEFVAAFQYIRQGYVTPVDDKKLLAAAIAGMVNSLDPHSAFLDKAALKELDSGTTGNYVGVGIECEVVDGTLKVTSTMDDSPAARAGIRVGDRVAAVDGVAVSGLTLEAVSKRIRGRADTGLVLSIVRGSATARPIDIALKREQVQQRSVRSSIIEPGYAWLRIAQFQTTTVDDLADNLKALYRRDPQLKGLVLDLRNDPGGLLSGAIGVASAFLPADAELVSTRGHLDAVASTLFARPEFYRPPGTPDPLEGLPAAIKQLPLVVLVNGGSASAAEIVAGALQDHDRATLLGTQTFGKGTVQATFQLPGDSALKLTVAKYYTPKGRSIQATGIVPDLLVEENGDNDGLDSLAEREADLPHHFDAEGQASSAAARHAETKKDSVAGAVAKRLSEPAAAAGKPVIGDRVEKSARTPLAESGAGQTRKDTSDKSDKAPTLGKIAAAISREKQAIGPEAFDKAFRPLDYGSKSDFQLSQALNHLKKLPVRLSKPAGKPVAELGIFPGQSQTNEPRQAGPPPQIVLDNSKG